MSRRIHFKKTGRELAMQFLFQYDMNDGNFEDADLIRFFRQLDESGTYEESRELRRAKKFTSKIINGVIQNITEIDNKIQEYISEDWSWTRVSAIDKCILRLSTYEMLFDESVPPIVSINEAVDLSKKFGSETSRSFVNGLLNSIKNSLKRDPRNINNNA